MRLTSPSSAPDPTACFDACAAEAPDWTPDGSRLYFDSQLDAVRAHLVDEAGRDGRPAETFSAGFDGFPSVSADGSMIVYEYDDVDDPGLSGIY